MTYKFKSFLYFLCFATAAFIYNKVEQTDKNFQNQPNTTASIVETDFEDSEHLEELQNDLTGELE